MIIFNKKANTFYKYVLSYILILLIPVIILWAGSFQFFMHMLEDEIFANNANALIRVKNSVDNQLQHINEITYQIYSNKALKSFDFESNPLEANKIKESLLSYKVASSFFDEIFIYFRGDNYLYSSTSSYTLEGFHNNFNFKNWDNSAMRNVLNTIVIPTFRSADDVVINKSITGKYVTYITPIPAFEAKPYATVMYLIDVNSFSSMMNSVFKSYQANIIILNKDSTPIYSSLDSTLTTDDFRKMLSASIESPAKAIQIKGQQYYISSVKSEYADWNYISVVSTGTMMKKIQDAQLRLLFSLLLILLFAGAAIYYTMKINYNPIKELVGAVAKKLSPENETFSDDLKSLTHTITNVFDENKALQTENKAGNKGQLLSKLLKGQYKDLETYNNDAVKADAGFVHTNYFVGIIHDESHSGQSGVVEPDEIEKLITEDFEGYIKYNYEQNIYIAILAIEQYAEEKVEALFKNIQSYMREKLNTTVTVGIGNSYGDISQIPNSFLDASAALDYKLILGSGKIIFNKDIPQKFVEDSYPYAQLDLLKKYIKAGNIEAINATQKELSSYIKAKNIPIFTARALCYDIINMVKRTLFELYSESVILANEYPDIFSLSRFGSIDELIEIVNNICNEICFCVQKRNDGQLHNLVEAIITYIKENYTSATFSVQEIADHFNMSLSNISQFFKEKTGETLLEYVTNLKIEKAKYLLESTDMAIKDVAEEMGYFNTPSFIRRFKQLTGVTPGEYRETKKN